VRLRCDGSQLDTVNATMTVWPVAAFIITKWELWQGAPARHNPDRGMKV
jgi:hypothetical protein